jgi:hypothetical protein
MVNENNFIGEKYPCNHASVLLHRHNRKINNSIKLRYKNCLLKLKTVSYLSQNIIV